MKTISVMLHIHLSSLDRVLFDSMRSLITRLISSSDEDVISTMSYRVRFNPISDCLIEAVITPGDEINSLSEDIICAELESSIERIALCLDDSPRINIGRFLIE